ncbi:TauD/TfdA dioxygenase family protein [Azospirillum doebereinerae]|uniref:TauD/TfdA family dioxygenase n=1 Tax=Azospirillum doebereinerae TaxID=92933 RepID=A0A433J083_9PROT|nr:TauD/TfdA family dioxygenase [Azospirillum doebereinerae]MCG5240612.1 TauD/TfdA family dioxygenase [Azospirillum doebereinerae]RUQ62013.1 TauD/TfdA family dioxygenase [Azospirillum doebereinerae]
METSHPQPAAAVRTPLPTSPETPVFQRLSGVLGAETDTLDLSRPLDPATVEAVRTAFRENHLLVIRNQSLDKERMYRFAELFGPIEGHMIRLADGSKWDAVHTITNLDAVGNPVAKPFISSNYFWHTDKSFLPEPSLLTMLQAVELPPDGGDTQFADMTKAYDALPEDTKRRIGGLKTVQSLEFMRRYTGSAPPTEEDIAAAPPIAHPLVRTHPETGRKSLYIGMYSSHIEGMPEEEGRALLEELLAHATQDRFIHTHKWRHGDLVFWDNRCLLHRAIANYEMGKHRRVLMRVVVKGDTPR